MFFYVLSVSKSINSVTLSMLGLMNSSLHLTLAVGLESVLLPDLYLFLCYY